MFKVMHTHFYSKCSKENPRICILVITNDSCNNYNLNQSRWSRKREESESRNIER